MRPFGISIRTYALGSLDHPHRSGPDTLNSVGNGPPSSGPPGNDRMSHKKDHRPYTQGRVDTSAPSQPRSSPFLPSPPCDLRGAQGYRRDKGPWPLRSPRRS